MERPAQLATSTFNQLGHHVNSSSHNCYAELAIFSLAVAVTIASTHFTSPRRDDQAELACVAWLNSKTVYPQTVTHHSVTTCWQLDFHVLTDKQTG